MTIRLAVAPESERLGARHASLLRELGASVAVVDGADALTAVVEGRAEVAAVAAEGLVRPSPGLSVVGALPRGEPRDVLIVRGPTTPQLSLLPSTLAVGAAGIRRCHLLGVHRPDLAADAAGDGAGLAGAFREGRLDAMVLSATEARAHAVDGEMEILDPRAWLSGPGQGAVALVARTGAASAATLARAEGHAGTLAALRAEWALARALGLEAGGRLGALAMVYGRWIRLWAMVPDAGEQRLVRADGTGAVDEPEALAQSVARLLLERGAGELLP